MEDAAAFTIIGEESFNVAAAVSRACRDAEKGISVSRGVCGPP
jgi:hypothetical protein